MNRIIVAVMIIELFFILAAMRAWTGLHWFYSLEWLPWV